MVARLIHRHAVADRLFCQARAGALADIGPGDTAVFGLRHTRQSPGAEFDDAAPQALRDASHAVNRNAKADDAGHANLIDIGDLAIAPARCGETVAVVAQAIGVRGGRAVMLGGGLSEADALAEGVLLSHADHPTALILLSNGVGLACSGDGGKAAIKLAIGANDLIPVRAHARWVAMGGQIVSAHAIQTGGGGAVEAAIAPLRGRHAVLILDANVVDSGYAAGASGFNVGGLSPRDVIEIVGRIAATVVIDAIALINHAPERDPRGHSETIAAEAARLSLSVHAKREAA